MKDYTKYYTPRKVAELLIHFCEGIRPESVIDICAGSWNLLNEAKKRWPNTTLTGVDINPLFINTYCTDGRFFAAESYKKNIKYDLVLANPPFEYEFNNKEIFREIGKIFNDHEFNGSVLCRLESTMLLFNSILVREGGILASVVPNSIIKAENQMPLRKYLSELYFIEKIIELPENAFGSSNIRTSIIILRNEIKREKTEIYRAVEHENRYEIYSEGCIENTNMRKGEWSKIPVINNKVKLTNLEILRNGISTNKMDKCGPGYPVIHSSSISGNRIDHRKLRYTKLDRNKYFCSQPGDVLIIRVGKDSGKHIILSAKDNGLLVSDCLLIVRVRDDGERKELLERLQSTDFTDLVKGVTTKYITHKDIKLMLNG